MRKPTGCGKHTGYSVDPFLTLLSDNEQELFTKAFIQCYRTSTWSLAGNVTGTRPRPMVAGTFRQATGHLAAAFRRNLKPSPIHIKGGTHLRPFV